MQIKKFKDALAKYGMDRCSIGKDKAKGLEEKELLALASIDLISKDLLPVPSPKEEKVRELVEASKSSSFSRDGGKFEVKEGKAMVAA